LKKGNYTQPFFKYRKKKRAAISVLLQQKIAAVGASLRRHIGPLPADIFVPRDGALFF
jgi:hypothetical protein